MSEIHHFGLILRKTGFKTMKVYFRVSCVLPGPSLLLLLLLYCILLLLMDLSEVM